MTKNLANPNPKGLKTRRISCSPRKREGCKVLRLGITDCCMLPPQARQGGLSLNPTSAAACRSRVLKAETSVLVCFLALQDFSCWHCWHCWDGGRERFLQIVLLHHSLPCLLLPTADMATPAQTPVERCKGAPTQKCGGGGRRATISESKGRWRVI